MPKFSSPETRHAGVIGRYYDVLRDRDSFCFPRQNVTRIYRAIRPFRRVSRFDSVKSRGVPPDVRVSLFFAVFLFYFISSFFGCLSSGPSPFRRRPLLLTQPNVPCF